MVKNHALFKKVAIGTLILAPFVAEMAARQSPAPVEEVTPQPPEAAAVAPPAPAVATMTAPALTPPVPLDQQSSLTTTAPFDPKPTLDPSAFAGAESPPLVPASGQPVSSTAAESVPSDGLPEDTPHTSP